MVGTNDGNPRVGVISTSQLPHRIAAPQKGVGSRGSEAADDLWTKNRELRLEEPTAVQDFLRGGFTITRRLTLDRIEDIDFVTSHPRSAQNPCQKLTCVSDKGLSKTVFVHSGGFTEEAKLGPRVTCPKNGMGARAGQVAAARTGLHEFIELAQTPPCFLFRHGSERRCNLLQPRRERLRERRGRTWRCRLIQSEILRSSLPV